MNRLSTDARAEIITALVEGASIRSIRRSCAPRRTQSVWWSGSAPWRGETAHRPPLSVSRMTGRSQNTIMRLLLDVKERQVPKAKRPESIGDVWTWVGLDADSKLVVGWLSGDRDYEAAVTFMRDLASRLANRVQLTTDGHWAYLKAVEGAFGWDGIDYAVLQKLYGRPTSDDTRYSPPEVIGIRKQWVMGKPVEALVSTSYVERQNLTLRMRCRRFTRLTNAFSKKLENHAAATALHYCVYNFCLTHKTLTRRAGGIHTTPAMAAGLTNRRWTVRDVVSLLDLQRSSGLVSLLPCTAGRPGSWRRLSQQRPHGKRGTAALASVPHFLC